MLQAKRAAMVMCLAVVAACTAYNECVAESEPGTIESNVLSTLIKNALTAVNHANLTGNYTVLRDLGSDRFRKRNSASDLSITFLDFRQKKIDFSAILALEPQVNQRPVECQGRVEARGFFPTRPASVHFVVFFQRVEAGWLIDEIAIKVGREPTKHDASAQRGSDNAAQAHRAP